MGRTWWVALALIAAVPARARADRAALEALLARTDAAAKEVAKLRGLRLKHAIPNEVVSKDELRKRLLKQAAEEKTAADTAAEGLALQRWGELPLGTDYTAMLVELLTEQIAGYYDPETKKLTLAESAGDDAAWADMVLAHELDHGLQDQAFDLKKFEDLPSTEGDASAARHALVEGDGIALMIEVMVAHNHGHVDWANPEIAAAISKAMASPSTTPGSDGLDHAPLAIRESMIFPYRAGFAFVAALRRRQPWSAVDAAFARPPKSTEQILHPEKYLADEQPVPIAAAVPPALDGYALAHSTVWGEQGFAVWLRSHGVDERTAEDAAAGWGGDRAILAAKPGETRAQKTVGLSRSEWDTAADAIEAAEAAGKALDDMVVGGTIERTDTAIRWLGVDGTASWVERRGASVVIVVGAPASATAALEREVWTATGVAPRATKKKRR